MSRTRTAKDKSTHLVDSEALRLQLEADGQDYSDDSDSEEGRTRLIHTLKNNDCREIITAVVDGSDLADVFVVVAASRGHVDILEAFLNHGMNIDIKDKYDWTALMYASFYREEECVRFLLERNASVDVQDNNGFTALMRASQNGLIKIVEMLLAKNANPDLQNNSGRTALMLATERGKKEIVELLLNHNADIELRNNNGKTALDLAKNEEIKEMIQNHVTTGYLLK